MASQNLELIRSIYEGGWAEGDFSSAEWAHPDCELVMRGGVEETTYSGLAAMAEGWADFLSAWDELRAVPDEYRELDDNRVVVVLHNVGRGKVSGLEVGTISQKSVNLFTIRDGKVTRLEANWDGEGALEQLGLDQRSESG